MLSRIVLSTAALIGSAIASEDQPREVTYIAANDCQQGGCRTPLFDKGYLFELKDYINAPPDGLAVYDPQGRIAYQVNIVAPDGTPGHLADAAAADADGTVLLGISYGGYGGRGRVKGGGIVVLDRSGQQIRFVDTGRFLPDAVCFGPDHSIWVTGTQFAPLRDGDTDHADRAGYNLVRKYSFDGRPMGAFLPRSLFPPGLPPSASGLSWMRASRDRIGIMTYPGLTSNAPEWVELDPAGALIGRWKLGPRTVGDPDTHYRTYFLSDIVFTEDGRLFGDTQSCPDRDWRQCSYEVVSFDRATSTWNSLGGSIADRFRQLLGTDGNDLVFWDRTQTNPPGVHLLRVRPGH